MCCSPWGHKESDTTERLNWTFIYRSHSSLYYYTVSPVPSIGGGLRVEQSYGLSPVHAENLFPHETVSPMWAGAIAIWISLCSQCWGGTFGVWAMCYHRYIKTRIQRTRRNRWYDSESMPSMRPDLLIRKCAHDPGQHPRHDTGMDIWFYLNQSVLSPLSKSPYLWRKNQLFLQKKRLEHFFSSLDTSSENESLKLSEGVFPCMEKTYLEQKQNDNTQKMLRREMRGLDSIQVSCHQGHLSTCHFHNLCQRNSWRVIKTVKTDSIQDYCNRAKETSV